VKCNRTACSATRDIVFYNSATRAYYCPKCARNINERNGVKLVLPHPPVAGRYLTIWGVSPFEPVT
jgi:hypothetical protein